MTEVFDEITVQRINIVDEDGRLRLALSNKARFPEGSIDGRVLQPAGARGPGMLFFNDDGDECGGLIYRGEGKERSAGAALLFDRLKQDQAVGLMYQEGSGRYGQGLFVWDRPDTSLAAGDNDEGAGAARVFAGREGDGSACLLLMDSKGRPRIRIAVDASDKPIINVLDEEGEVTWSFSPT